MKSIWHVFAHCPRLCKCNWSLFCSAFIRSRLVVFISRYITESSTKSVRWDNMLSGISLMDNRKMVGLRTEPWVNPDVTTYEDGWYYTCYIWVTLYICFRAWYICDNNIQSINTVVVRYFRNILMIEIDLTWPCTTRKTVIRLSIIHIS